MVAVPDNDIPDTHGDTDPTRTLDLRAAHLDGIAVTDVFLDRSRQPWRRHLKIDRTGAQPPPQSAEATNEDQQQDRDCDGKALCPTFTGEPAAHRSEPVAQPMNAGVRP